MSGVVVGGVDLEERFGLVLLGDSSFSQPEPKLHLMDVPGGDGSLDATEAFGDVVYADREDALVFFARGACGAEAFARLVTDLCRFLHGRRLDYSLPHDPGYTYRGRFVVEEAYSRFHGGRVKVAVTADPYKSAGVRVHTVQAQAGATVVLQPGRGRVSPVFESQMPVHVVAGGVDATLPAGSHTAVGLSVRSGDSEVYVNTGGSIKGGTALWGDFGSATWGSLGARRWHEAMWSGSSAPESAAYEVRIAYEVLEI